MGIPFWTDSIVNPAPGVWTLSPDPWSVIAVGTNFQLLPGLLENGDIHWRKNPHRVIDKGRKPATDGATPKLLGIGVSEFDLKMIIYTSEELNALQTILPSIWPGKSSPIVISPSSGGGVAPGNGIPGAQFTLGLNLTQSTAGGGTQPSSRDNPIYIYHPALALAGISYVFVEGWTPPVRWQGKNDVKMYVIHCLEARDSVNKKAISPKLLGKPAVNDKLKPKQGAGTPPSQGGAGPAPAL